MSEVAAKTFANELSVHTARIGKAISLCGFIGSLEDIARPLGPIAVYVAALSLIVLCISVPVGRLLPGFREEINILRWCLILLTGISVVLLVAERGNPRFAERGVLASSVPAIGQVQKLLLGMDAHLATIESNTQRTAESIDKLQTSAKKETSSDPRKELDNTGVKWDYDNFLKAQALPDVRTMTLFLAGGMRPKRGIGPLIVFVGHDFSKEIAQLYLAQNVFDSSDVCPAILDQYIIASFYFAILNDTSREKAKFLRAVCGTVIKQPLETLIRSQEADLASTDWQGSVGERQEAAYRRLKMLTMIREQVAAAP